MGFAGDWRDVLEEVGRGCEMAFWPVMTVPSARPALMWWLKLEFIAGMTCTFSGTPVMDPKR